MMIKKIPIILLKYKKLPLLLCGLLFFLSISASAIADTSVDKIPPKAKNGVLDLREWDFDKDGVINLNGEWEFYWESILSPNHFRVSEGRKTPEYTAVPGVWNGKIIQQKPLSGDGYATYRLRILLPAKGLNLTLKTVLIGTSFSLYTNGKWVCSNGTVATNSEDSSPEHVPTLSDITIDEDSLDIVVHVSNYYHKKGGIRRPIQLGLREDVYDIWEKNLMLDILLFGSILIMGFYHFGLFIIRRKEQHTLYFSLFCFLIALRIIIGENVYILKFFPSASYETLMKLEYFTFIPPFPIFVMFINSLFYREFSTVVLRIVQIIGTAATLLVMATPVKVYSNITALYEVLILVVSLYIIYTLVLAVKRSREGAVVFLFGGLLCFFLIINDALNTEELIHTINIFHFGVFVLLISQALAIYFRFSKAFMSVETLTYQLKKHGETLEIKIEERTDAIQSLLDNTGQGFLTFNSSFVIGAEYSNACKIFFNSEIKDRDVFDSILTFGISGDVDEIRDVLSMVFQGNAEFEAVKDLLPKEIDVSGRTLKLEYKAIKHGKFASEMRIMVILTDISIEKKLTRKIEQEDELKDILISVARDRESFVNYINDLRTMLFTAKQLLKEKRFSDIQGEVFRIFHTIKGLSASFSMERVSKKAHLIESELTECKKEESGKLTHKRLSSIFQEIDQLEKELETILSELAGIIRLDEIESKEKFYKIVNTKIVWLKDFLIHKMGLGKTVQINKIIEVLCAKPLALILRKYARTADELAIKFDKKIQTDLEGLEVEVDYQRLDNLFNSLFHLIRNAIDHGIEPPLERKQKKKPEVGTLRIKAEKVNNYIKFSFSDDGKGIDRDTLAKTALEKKVINNSQLKQMSEEELLNLIFEPGLSTKEEVSEISGRGIGMNAVKVAVEELGGTIRLISEPSIGTTFEIIIPPTPAY